MEPFYSSSETEDIPERKTYDPTDLKNSTASYENDNIDDIAAVDVENSTRDQMSAERSDTTNHRTCENIDQISLEADEIEFWEKLNLYSDEEDEVENSLECTFSEQIASWALRNHNTRSSINELLSILRENGHPELLKDARTLLGTPRKVSCISPCGTGAYLHYGLERALTDLLKKSPQNTIPHHILLDLNFDGLPLAKSSRSQLWPILGKIAGESYPEVFLIGAYHGYEKPQSVDEYVNPFIEEYEILKKTGFSYDQKKYTVEINIIICDSPARSMITLTKSHNSHFGCPRCLDEGDYINHRMCFLSTSSPLRSDESFLSKTNIEHHKGVSPFEKIGLKMITQFPFIPMHLRDLGLMKKMLKLILNNPKKEGKLRAEEINNLSKILLSLKTSIPCEFVRKPRSLQEVDRFKAAEFRLIFYYIAPLAFNQVLSPEYTMHFNALHSALTVLNHPREHKRNNDFAKEQLKWFLENFKNLYGEGQLVYTFHCAQHLADEVLLHGILDQNTAYPFENYMQTIKKYIRRPSDVLAQVFCRIMENGSSRNISVTKQKVLNSLHFSNPLKINVPFGCNKPYSKLFFSNFKLSIKEPDNCCYLRNGKVIFIQHIAHKGKEPVIIGKEFRNLSSFPNYPGNSQDLELYVAQDFSDIDAYPVSQIEKRQSYFQ